MTALVVAEAFAIALLGLLVTGLLRSHAEILHRLHDLGAGLEEATGAGPQDVEIQVRPGLPVPADRLPVAADIVGDTPAGEMAAVALTDDRDDTLVAFLTTGCATCASFWRDLEADRVGLPPATRVLIVTKGADAESMSAVRALAPAGVTVVASTQAWADYDVAVAPYFVHVSRGRVIGAGAAASWQQVQGLLRQAFADLYGGSTADGRDNAARVDAELIAAGITPGHPSLRPAREPDPEGGA